MAAACSLTFALAFLTPGTGEAMHLAPWWLTGWLLIGVALGSLGLAALWAQWWLRRLIRRNVVLEERLEANGQALETASRALRDASLMDSKTRLHNRRFLEASLSADTLQAQRAYGDMLAAGRDPLAAKEDILLYLIDLDDFTSVNATWGPHAGDAVLSQLAQTLKGVTRKTDFRARWEGSTLLLVARRARRAGAATVARHLLSAVRDLNFLLPGGERIQNHVSIGFTALPLHPAHPDLGSWQQAMAMAEQCLTAAKESGRDRWVGALLRPDQDPAPLMGVEVWDVAWAGGCGLLDVQCSEPDFVWPG